LPIAFSRLVDACALFKFNLLEIPLVIQSQAFIMEANETLFHQIGIMFIQVTKSFHSPVILSNVHDAILLLLVLILTTAQSNIITNVVMIKYHTSHPAYSATSLKISPTKVISVHAVVL
jgi:hypothetical protein